MTVLSCFVLLRQLRSIRRSVSDPVLQSLVVALVLTKLDYGSATLAGLPAVQLDSCATNLPTLEDRSRVTFAQGTALAASARAYHLPVGSSCLPMSAQHGAALPHRPVSTGEQCWLQAFSLTAAHVWNSLPTAVQSSESLDIFRRHLKTELFEHSYN